MRIATYDLRKCIASFDFFTWLVTVRAMGATHVQFRTEKVKTTKWPEAQVMERYHTILRPGPALAGMDVVDRPFVEGKDHAMATPHLRDLVHRMKVDGFKPWRLVSVFPPAPGVRYTVTMRGTGRSLKRNSDEKTWREFAAEIGATVIEDHAMQATPLHWRMALYAAARMNYGVVNGPMHMLSFSIYPMAMFDCQNSKDFARNDLPPGSAYPWAAKDQHFVWSSPTPDNLRRYHEKQLRREG